MGYMLEFNSLLKLPKSFDNHDFVEGQKMKIKKDGERLFPLHKPIEFCDSDYRYIGKLEVNSLTIARDLTTLEVTILKIFSEEEARVFSDAYIEI